MYVFGSIKELAFSLIDFLDLQTVGLAIGPLPTYSHLWASWTTIQLSIPTETLLLLPSPKLSLYMGMLTSSNTMTTHYGGETQLSMLTSSVFPPWLPRIYKLTR